MVQSYTYDPLNRLTQAQEMTGSTQNWIQQFGYDIYGNRTSFSQTIGTASTSATPSVNANNNRFNTGQGYGYDSNGNVTSDVDPLTTHSRAFTFNGDNKQTQVTDTSASHVVGQYYYDGEGKRVKKVTDAETTVFVYDGKGKLVAEYSTALSSTPTVAYTTTDHLGSPRITTDQNGAVTARRDFLPFGEEIAQAGLRTSSLKYVSATDNVRQKFTGYQRDSETSLDFAQARMYDQLHGRFNAVDPLTASGIATDAQTWNRYGYALGRPLIAKDPSGRKPEWVQASGEVFYDSRVKDEADAKALYGDNAKFRANGSSYTSTDGSKIDLLDGGKFLQNGTEQDNGDRAANASSQEHTFGYGWTANFSAVFGLMGGAASTGEASGGYFYNRQTNRFVSGGMLSYGAQANPPLAGSPDVTLSVPKAENTAITFGRSAGVGTGMFLTNASRPEQVAGPFFTRQLNTPVFSAQYSSDTNGTRVFSVSVGPSLGGSYWQGTTTTIASPSLTPVQMTPTVGRPIP